MHHIDGTALAELPPYAALVDALSDVFVGNVVAPVRQHHAVGGDADVQGTLLIMPAWRQGDFVGVKVATVFPHNNEKGLPSVMASYLLLDGGTGRPLALLDGEELTARRTAAASALASRHLSRPESRNLLMVGTERLAPHLIRALVTQRPIDDVAVWGRTPEKADRLTEDLAAAGLPARSARKLRDAVDAADIISCATLSPDPLVLGAWLRPGQHLDLVGGFTPHMRETDDEAVSRATVYVDTRDGALAEAGDILQPLERGIIDGDDIAGDLFDLVTGGVRGRQSADEITLFKSVGTAVEDLGAAVLAYETFTGSAA